MNINLSIIGSSFLLISAILYSVRYICAAIGTSTSKVWSEKEFLIFLNNVPNTIFILSFVSFVLGILLIVFDIKKAKKN